MTTALTDPAAPPTTFTGTVAADLTALVVVRDSLAVALVNCGWSEPDAFRVLLCADEAMANALTHGTAAAAGSIELRFAVDADTAEVAVIDHHRGTAKTIAPLQTPDDTCEHGRGLILMRALADTCRVARSACGTRVVLGFRRGNVEDR